MNMLRTWTHIHTHWKTKLIFPLKTVSRLDLAIVQVAVLPRSHLLCQNNVLFYDNFIPSSRLMSFCSRSIISLFPSITMETTVKKKIPVKRLIIFRLIFLDRCLCRFKLLGFELNHAYKVVYEENRNSFQH